ncbi:paired immunoglobulin-like type 2 receptor alpha isoform X2 [Sciurus carolinensis]|uniref:paired immunoglobulin-like type 2 receptor alpha isoform X2 n=1 Tax=Sciurus carolinensis TaxID=30640 RepID=UPI001FB1EA16|nr:paired immunoglobulin-like type 2 receptor alpha isoform X2 [Sciurus carolinensis]
MPLMRVPQGLLHRASSPALTALLVSSPGGQQTMGWVLLPLLLLLPPPTTSLHTCHSAGSREAYSYGVNQPKNISAPKGGSVSITFSFCYPWEIAKNPNVKISWRRKEFHGPFFYNQTPAFTHEDFKDRLSLDWKKGQNFGSLTIRNLREEDRSTYFCRVQLNTKNEGVKQWQSIEGTALTITPAVKTSKTTTTGIEVTESKMSPGYQSLSLGATVGVALATAVFVTAIWGLMVLLRWKRSKGQPTKVQSPVSELFPNTEKQYENVGYTGHDIDLKVNPEDDNIVYASLFLPNSTLPGAAPSQTLHRGSPEETLYSVLKV